MVTFALSFFESVFKPKSGLKDKSFLKEPVVSTKLTGSLISGSMLAIFEFVEPVDHPKFLHFRYLFC